MKEQWELVKKKSYRVLDFTLIAGIAGSLLLFILWPVGAVFLRSIQADGEWTLQLYREVVPNNLEYLGHSIFVAGLSTFLALGVAVCIAVYVCYSKGRLAKMMPAFLLLTMISPPFVSSLAYITLFGRRGVVTHGLLGLSVNPYGWHGIVMMQALGEISLTALLLIGVLYGMDVRILQASRDLGANSWETLRRIVFPLLLPGIGAAGFVAFVRSLADFGTAIIIGGKYSVLATEAYLAVIGRGELGKASVLSVMLLVPALAGAFLYRKTDIGNHMGDMLRAQHEAKSILDFGRILKIFLAFVTWGFVIVMLLQVTAIFWAAFTRYNGQQYVLTWEYLASMNTYISFSILRSLAYSLLTGIAASLIGVILAYYVDRRHIWGGKALDFVASLPYIIPGTLFGIGYVLAFHEEPLLLTGTVTIVILNCVYRQITVAAKAGSAVLAQISPDIENAGRDLGVHRLAVLRDVMLPLMKPALFVSFTNGFTSTMMTIGSLIFLISPGAKVATVELFGLLNQGKYGEGAVLALVLVGVTLAVNGAVGWMAARGYRKS